MTYILVIAGFILGGGLVFYFVRRNQKPAFHHIQPKNNQEPARPLIKENAFEGLRNKAFTVTPELLGLSLPEEKTTVYGVIMDWEMEGAVATTISYQTGDASMYLSSGGGVIGGGQHQNVSDAAKLFVNVAQTYLDKASKTEANTLPSKSQVMFYLLTNKGLYVGQEHVANLENASSEWFRLFEEGNKVLTELRLTTEKK